MTVKTLLTSVKALAGKTNWNELYTLLLLSFGVPAVIYMWIGIKGAVTSFVLIQIVLGILRERN